MWKRLYWLSLATGSALSFVMLLSVFLGETTAVAAPATPLLIINEIHADPDGTHGDANGDGVISPGQDEFVELINVSGGLLDMGGWELHDDIGRRYTFPASTLLPHDCALLIFGGGTPAGAFGGSIVLTANGLMLNNDADTITIKDALGTDVATYSYGSEGGDNQSLTRHPDITGPEPLIKHTIAANSSASLFSPGTQVGGDPFGSCQLPPLADLVAAKNGPATAVPGYEMVYEIHLQNSGDLTATQIILTDSLPTGLVYIGHSGSYTFSQPDAHTLVWQLGNLSPQMDLRVYLTTSVTTTVANPFTNTIWATTPITEINTGNNRATAVTRLNQSGVLIDALHYYGYDSTLDEAVALRNVSAAAIDVGGWTLSDGAVTATLPTNVIIAPGARLWVSNDAAAFQRQFGHAPNLAKNPGATAVPALIGAWPGFANTGDEALLGNSAGYLVDTVVYQSGNTSQPGWSGPAVQPYAGSNLALAGQILYRMRDQATGLPVADTDTAADWAQDTNDVINGRKTRYPGWDWDDFFQTVQVTETAVLTVAIAPDNAYEAIVAHIEQAETSIRIQSHTIESVAIGQVLAQAAGRGVSVTLLLEGGPPGGLPDQEKYVCQQIELAGGQCWFMINDAAAKIYDRYSYLHAKFMIIDERLAIIGSQNLSPHSLPDDDKSDGTWGRRGVMLLTDAPTVVAHLQALWEYDLDHNRFQDLFRWQADHTRYGGPPPGFVPITTTGGITYPVRFPAPVAVTGLLPLEIIQSPENSLRDVDGLLGLLHRAGPGDEVLVQQLYERPYWGPSSGGNPVADPNPRLAATIDAARRGASVRLLLDSFFDDGRSPTSNQATCAYVNGLAQQERLNLRCALANPTGLGIHNKMVLVRLNGRGYIHIGSLNGSEQSHKDNREVALQVQSDALYALLANMFTTDWPHRQFLPILFNNFIGPAHHILISEVMYDPPGADTTEFIELVNPTPLVWDLSGFSLGDAVHREDFEDVRRFPPGTLLPPGKTVVVATSAVDFYAEYGFYPDFEILGTETAVADLIDDPTWGDPATFLQLGNQGDEVILRNAQDQVVDVVTYGSGSFPGVTTCPLVQFSNASLERFPYWRDTNNCATDFREWPFPNPGFLP